MFLSCITVFKFLRFSVNFQTEICKFKTADNERLHHRSMAQLDLAATAGLANVKQNEIHWRLAGPLIR
jgi:hypothetical protein